MGPMNWLAVIVAAFVGAAVLHLVERREGGARRLGVLALVMLAAAAMLGHALARIGADKLALKPWLYFMQSGGLALAFVVPALLASGVRLPRALGWLAAYLALGAVFFALA